jgi:hypothetical protein
MTSSDLLACVGAVTGIGGLIAGVVGARLGYLGYRRTGELKALDLRIELRKAENETRAILGQLPDLIGQAQASRTSVFVASGGLGSNQQIAWQQECEKDRAEVKALLKELPTPSDDYWKLPPDELESRLVSLDALKGRAARLQDKCHRCMAADEKSREQLPATEWVKRP